MKGGQNEKPEAVDLEDRQEMNELVESDPELYGGDTEEMTPPMKKKPIESEREKLKAEMKGHLKKNDKEEN